MDRTMRGRIWRCVLGSLTGISAIAMMAHPAVAGVVVNWGGDYFTGWNSLDPGPPSGTGNAGDIYDDPIVPVSSSAFGGFISGRAVVDGNPYSPDNPKTSAPAYAEFYGGHAAVFSTNADVGARRLGIEGGGGTTADELHVDVKPNSLQRFAMLTYWKVNAGFTIADSSVFSLASKQDAQGEGGHTLRWVLRDATGFYISGDVNGSGLTFSNNSPYTSVMSSLKWRPYRPYDPLTINAGGTDLEHIFYSTYTVSAVPEWSARQFSNVDAVGFYVEYIRPANVNPNAARGPDYKITQFNANLQNAVPEPGTFLFGLAGFGGVALRRWRQRRKTAAADVPATDPAGGLS